MGKGTPEQRRKWNQKYYQKNKVARREQYTRYREETKQWYRDLKSKLQCHQCGFSHPAALHFHHLNNKDKVLEISEMMNRGMSRDKILSEIEKCIVLCANCHAVLHYEERNE